MRAPALFTQYAFGGSISTKEFCHVGCNTAVAFFDKIRTRIDFVLNLDFLFIWVFLSKTWFSLFFIIDEGEGTTTSRTSRLIDVNIRRLTRVRSKRAWARTWAVEMLRQPEAWKESRKNKIWEEKLPKRAGRFLAMRNFGQTHTNTQHWFYRHLIRSTLKPIEIVRIIGICFSQRDLKKLFLPSSSHTFKTGSLLFTTVKYNLKKVVPLATSCFFLPWEPKKLTRKNHESTRKLIFVGLSAWLKNL